MIIWTTWSGPFGPRNGPDHSARNALGPKLRSAPAVPQLVRLAIEFAGFLRGTLFGSLGHVTWPFSWSCPFSWASPFSWLRRPFSFGPHGLRDCRLRCLHTFSSQGSTFRNPARRLCAGVINRHHHVVAGCDGHVAG